MKYYALVGKTLNFIMGICTELGKTEPSSTCRYFEIPEELCHTYGTKEFEVEFYKLYPYLRPNRNEELINDLATYCKEHPEQRFWQAVRNWSGAYKVILEIPDGDYSKSLAQDTFNFEHKLS